MKQAYEPANENIQSIADRFEISNLLMNLAVAIDTNDSAALDDIFTANAVMERSPQVYATSQHQVSNADIRIDGDTAIGQTLCHTLSDNQHRHDGRDLYYVDKLQRTAEGWRIIERSIRAKGHR